MKNGVQTENDLAFPSTSDIQFCANAGVVLRLINVASFLGRQSYNLILHYTAFFTNKLMIQQLIKYFPAEFTINVTCNQLMVMTSTFYTLH